MQDLTPQRQCRSKVHRAKYCWDIDPADAPPGWELNTALNRWLNPNDPDTWGRYHVMQRVHADLEKNTNTVTGVNMTSAPVRGEW